MSDRGELLRTETIGRFTFEFRRGPVWCPIVVWRDDEQFGRFESGPLATGGDQPRIEVENVSDLLWRRGKPSIDFFELRRIAAQIWREERART